MPAKHFAAGQDIFFDPATMPTPLTHADLMGRPRITSNSTSKISIPSLPDILAPTPPPKDRPTRPALHKRSSSLEDLPAPRNRAGVGIRGMQSDIKLIDETRLRVSIGGTPRPGVIRRTSSFELPPPQDIRPILSKADLVARAIGKKKCASSRHSRTSSESSTNMSTRQPSPHSSLPVFQSQVIHLRPTSSILKLLTTLQSLTPPRRNIRPLPLPTSGLLNPTSLLTPLSIILEALVSERTLLRSPPNTAIPPIPPLQNGSNLQLVSNGLDWETIKMYILTLGGVLNTLIPLLRTREGVEELIKSVRVYVGKLKKVFGEVAQGYVEGYGFVRGWWDEGGMKGSAGEVGRWGDVFDA